MREEGEKLILAMKIFYWTSMFAMGWLIGGSL